MKKHLLLPLLLLFGVLANAQTLTTQVGTTLICDSSVAVTVSYSDAVTSFQSGNFFKAELSDASGTFASPTTLWPYHYSTSASGSFQVYVPSYIWAYPGTGYRIRVVSSSPQITGSDNGTDITVIGMPPVAVSPVNASICVGQSVGLTASGAATYSWSPAAGLSATTGAIVQASPTVPTMYTVTGVNAGGCGQNSAFTLVYPDQFQTVFRETIGTTQQAVSIANHETANDFDNDQLSMSGTASIMLWTGNGYTFNQNYSGASKGAAVAFPSSSSTGGVRSFQISGINTSGLNDLQLSFGVFRNMLGSNGSELVVETSVNGGTTFVPIAMNPLATGPGTTTYQLATSSGTIPASSFLILRFRNTSINTLFLVDDIILRNAAAAPVITSSGNSICQSNVQLNASYGASYSWSTGATNQNISVSQAGSYQVEVTDANGCTAQSAPFVINPDTISVSVAGTTNICPGDSLMLYANGPAAATYNWTTPAGTVTGQQIYIANPTVANSGAYTVTASMPGCGSDTEIIQVNVSALPLPSVTDLSGNSPVCEGQTLNLSADATNASSYEWYGPCGFSSVSQYPVIQAATICHTGTYMVTMVNADGCSVSQSLPVEVSPVIPAITIANSGPFCTGGIINLQPTTVAGASYVWTMPNGDTSHVQNLQIGNASAAHSGQYMLEVTQASGAACNTVTAFTNVLVNTTPPTPVASNNGPLCIGQQLQLSASGSFAPGTTFLWKKGAATVATTQNPALQVNFLSNGGTYTVTASNGCTSAPATTQVTVTQGPGSVFVSPNPYFSIVCPGTSLTLTADNSGNSTATYPFTWSGPNNFSATGAIVTIPFATAADYGNFTVTAGSGNCTVSTVFEVLLPPSLDIQPLGPVCAGSDVYLNADSAHYLATGYSWTGPNGFTSNQLIPVIPNVSAADAGTYTGYVLYNGCASDPATVTVTLGALQVNAASSGSLYQGETLFLSASGSPGPYTWTGPNNFSAIGSNPYIQNAAPAHSGDYTVTINAAGCPSVSSITSVQVNPMNLISGKVFNDLDNNGVQSPSEPGLINRVIEVQPGNYTAATNYLGEYSLYVPAGNYTIEVQGLSAVQASNPATQSVGFTGTNSSSGGHDFAIYSTVTQDLKITVAPITNAKPGYMATHKVRVSNLGGAMVNVNARFLPDPLLTFDHASLTPMVSGDTLIWNMWLSANSYWDVYVYSDLPTGTALGTLLNSAATITPTLGDATPANNYFTLQQTVVGSWDPNDKLVQPAGDILQGQVATGQEMVYTVRFQNTGTAPADNVLVVDTLSGNLDLNTFEMLSASHDYYLNLRNPGILEWKFNNIMLPDSNTNEPESHGFVQYRIRPLSTLGVGDKIENTAHIYFDFNEAIVTNTTVTEVGLVSAPEGLPASKNLLLYPNPNTGKFTIELSDCEIGNLNISLTNLLGQQVYTEAASTNNTAFTHQLNVQNLPAGVYLLQVSQGSKLMTKRMVIQK